LGDRRSYGNGRGSVPNDRIGATRYSDRSQRNLLAGVGFFVAALAIIDLILFTGGGDDEPNDQRGLVGEQTATATGESSPAAPSQASTSTSTTTTGTSTASSTTGIVPPTATSDIEDPTSTTAEETDEPEPTETEDLAVVPSESEPTEAPEDEEPAPTEEAPSVGDFGTLPPAQIVSGGLSRSLDLDYDLATSLANTPSSAPVYLLEFPAWDESDVATIADNLGLDGEVEGGPGNYQVVGSTAEIYFSGPTIQYVYTGSLPDLPLGDDANIIQSASDWIYANGFIGGDIDGGVIIGRDDDAGRAVVLFRPADVSRVLSFVPSATVTVGPGGTVVEARIRWPSNYIPSDYGLWSGDTLWNRVLAGQGAVEADLSGVGGSGALSGVMTVYDVSIAYSYAGDPSGDEYLVPLVVFSGEATINETGDVVQVSIYVAAIAGQATPQG
jgi:hypothetical protein